jgi:hypothetical protein
MECLKIKSNSLLWTDVVQEKRRIQESSQNKKKTNSLVLPKREEFKRESGIFFQDILFSNISLASTFSIITIRICLTIAILRLCHHKKGLFRSVPRKNKVQFRQYSLANTSILDTSISRC